MSTFTLTTCWRLKTSVPLLAVAGLLFTLNVRGQPYSIDWYTIDGGGGSRSGGTYQLSGTIGQPDASAALNGGSYSLIGGFWSLLSVVQTPGGPLLKILLTSTNTAVVFWPSPSTGFGLQQNANLSTTNWMTPAETVNDNGVSRFIIVSPPTGIRFYRLFKP